MKGLGNIYAEANFFRNACDISATKSVCMGIGRIKMTDICRFKFDESVNKEMIEEQIALAIITAECTFGQAKVRLNAAYLASNHKAVIDVSNEVGEHIAQVFIGLMTRKLGEDKFTVERIKKQDDEL